MEKECYTKFCNNGATKGSIFCEDCSATPKSILGEDEIEQTAKKLLQKTTDKMLEQVSHDFYDSMSEHLYEHSNNYRDKIMEEAFELIIGKQWANKYRDKYETKQLRARIFEEHKDDIKKDITEQVVENEIKRYFGLFLTDEEKTDWKYRDLERSVIDWIYNNYSKSKILKEKLPEKLIKENESLKEEVKRLNDRILEINDLTD